VFTPLPVDRNGWRRDSITACTDLKGRTLLPPMSSAYSQEYNEAAIAMSTMGTSFGGTLTGLTRATVRVFLDGRQSHARLRSSAPKLRKER
jgi:hypothetical protein